MVRKISVSTFQATTSPWTLISVCKMVSNMLSFEFSCFLYLYWALILCFMDRRNPLAATKFFVLVKTKRRAYSRIVSVYPERDKKEGVGRIPSHNRSAKHRSSDRWEIKISRHLASLLTITALIKYFFTFFRLYKSLLPIIGIIYFLFISLPFAPPLVWWESTFCQIDFISELLAIEFSFGYLNAASSTSASRIRMTDSYVEICKELMIDHDDSQGEIKKMKGGR